MLSSTLEHAVPEILFKKTDGSNDRPNAFSAAKALEIALKGGQRIYHIIKDNQTAVLQKLNLDSLAMSEIRDALATGNEVITHTNQLSVEGFTGSGYIIFNPDTGDGAYKISDGKNGAFIITLMLVAASLLMPLVLLSGGWILGAVAMIIFSFFNAYSWIEGIKAADTPEEFQDVNTRAAFGAFFSCIYGLMGMWAAGSTAALEGFVAACGLLMDGLFIILGWM